MQTPQNPKVPRAAAIVVTMFLTVATGVVIYRLLAYGGISNSAALFIGLPTVLGILLTLCVHPKGLYGTVFKASTLFLLLSGPLLNEGFVCVLFAAPLFYGVVFMAVLIFTSVRDELRELRGRSARSLLALPLLLASLEGTHTTLALPRTQQATAEQVVPATAAEVEATLAAAPRFEGDLPEFLRLGFPTPAGAQGSGLAVGDRRVIGFRTASGRVSQLTLEVAESEPGRVRFVTAVDQSALRKWLLFRESEVRWQEVAPGQTQVRWTASFDRILDPAWYFAPLEQYGVERMAHYLIGAAATPPPGGRP